MQNLENNQKKNFSIACKDITVLVPAAGYVNSACNYQLANKDPGFINIGSSLAIQEIKKKTIYKIVLAVKKKDLNIYKLNPYSDVQIIEINRTENITDTIKKSLKFIDTKWCLINPITTVPFSNDLYSGPFIEFGSKMLPKENWASLIYENGNKPLFLNKSDKDFQGNKSYPFTGRIFAKTIEIKKAINKIKDFEKNDLINLAINLFNSTKIEFKYAEWLDIGHLATYPLTRISSINSRFFNKLTFDEKKNTIKKRSSNKLKIEQEILFYKTIPNELKRYFPMIFKVENKNSEISYEMEYIGKPNLSEIYLFSKIGPNAIMRIFNSLEVIYKTFYEGKYLIKDKVDCFYHLKTSSRQNEIEDIIQKKDYRFFKEIYNYDFKVNNFKFPALKKTFELLIKELLKFDFKRKLYLGHGDLCFNNILVDPIFGTINLIDPKAEKHKATKKYGLIDNVYDLSKLNHSVEGLYDSVVNNLFRLKILDINNINFEIYKPLEYKIYNYYFKEIILYKRIDPEYLRLLTANLFLSMLPMHIDNVDRIIGFSLIGSIFMSNYSIDEILL